MVAAPEDSTRVIKRYANRKLYDTKESHYVTLQEVAELVRSGEDVRIIDNKSKEDLTRVTLAQIIYEEEKSGNRERSVGGLRNMIEQGADRLIHSIRDAPRDVRDFFKETIEELQRIADDRVRSLLTRAAQHVDQLQGEVHRLQQRIEELEERVAQRSIKPGETDEKVE